MNYALLLLSNFLVFGLTFVTMGLITNIVEPKYFGVLKLLMNNATLYSIAFSFGINYGLSYILARENDSSSIDKSLFSHLLLNVAFLLISTPLIFLLSYFLENEMLEIQLFFIFSILFFCVNLLNLYTSSAWIGLGYIRTLSILNFIPQLFIFVIILIFKNSLSNLLDIIYIFLIVNLGISVLKCFYLLRGREIKFEFNKAIVVLKNYSFKLYQGAIVGAGAPLALLALLSAIYPSEFYGLLVFSYTFVAPFQLISSTNGQASFKKFNNKKDISILRKALFTSFLLILIGLFVFWQILDYLFLFLFSKEYFDAKYMIVGFAIYGAIIGLGDIINKYRASQGESSEVRFASILSGLITILASLIISIFEYRLVIIGFILGGVSYVFFLSWNLFMKIDGKYNGA